MTPAMFVTEKANQPLQILIHCVGTLALATLPVLVGCDGLSGPAPGDDGPALNARTEALSIGAATQAKKSEVKEGLATFRRATARYHRVEAAVEDGFEQILPCLSNPNGEGALGIPYAKLDRFDETINLAEPEILFYEPQKNGPLRLVGGEPVIPIDLWTEDEPPSLFGLEFHRNEAHGLFGLHMWVWRNSPQGVFSFWNANVSCEFAE